MNAKTTPDWMPAEQKRFLDVLTPLNAGSDAAFLGYHAGDEYGNRMKRVREEVEKAAAALGFRLIPVKAGPTRVIVESAHGDWIEFDTIEEAADFFYDTSVRPWRAIGFVGDDARDVIGDMQDIWARFDAEAAADARHEAEERAIYRMGAL